MINTLKTPEHFVEGKHYLIDNETEVVLLEKMNEFTGKVRNVKTCKISPITLSLLGIKY